MRSNRAEPDISLNASIGQNIYDNGRLSGNGGTSIVAPEVSGQFAQMNAYLLTSGRLRATAPRYARRSVTRITIFTTRQRRPHHPYYDITSGCTSNDIGGGWCAGTGYDLATGLGSFNSLMLAWDSNWFNIPEGSAPTVSMSGPSASPAWVNGGTISWTVVDSGSPAPTGVAGYTAQWDGDPGDPFSEPHGGSGNPFYSGPAVQARDQWFGQRFLGWAGVPHAVRAGLGQHRAFPRCPATARSATTPRLPW